MCPAPVNLSRILLVEDDSDVREALADHLRYWGFEVRALSSGSELLSAVAPWVLQDEETSFDLIISDIRLPGFNGLTVCEWLRANGLTEPILFISAMQDPSLHDRVRELGRARFLSKPFEDRELRRVMAELALEEDPSDR